MTSTVARAIKQTKPFASPEEEVLLGLQMAGARVIEPWSAYLKTTAALTVSQYNVLRILRGAGDDGLPTLTIGQRMLEDSPGVTRLVDRLVAKGLVTRARSKEDRRQILCRIAPSGLDLLAQMDGVVDTQDESALGMLTPDEQKELIRKLEESLKGDTEQHAPREKGFFEGVKRFFSSDKS